MHKRRLERSDVLFLFYTKQIHEQNRLKIVRNKDMEKYLHPNKLANVRWYIIKQNCLKDVILIKKKILNRQRTAVDWRWEH